MQELAPSAGEIPRRKWRGNSAEVVVAENKPGITVPRKLETGVTGTRSGIYLGKSRAGSFSPRAFKVLTRPLPTMRFIGAGTTSLYVR